ncbi:hypothetical protein PPERSA_11170 [Pseudocohnilembus persalinus]|uniref:Uncharacterized protein n=1 Tax=Pseudocohnilembus persalinus TaxID=266149 RepID=A0A0V0R0C0_PSEPJ|nr:hypothetical protein PPERSA_11170 [Pseudocohnilembus persalinus]|eukprot:KRX07621.1 hypothetical protein PPERSA_11170 [Pseudocohnilembus persalinus]
MSNQFDINTEQSNSGINDKKKNIKDDKDEYNGQQNEEINKKQQQKQQQFNEKQEKINQQRERLEQMRRKQKEMMETEQAEKLKQKINKQNSNFSTYTHLFTILKGKIVFGALLLLGLYKAYQIYQVTEYTEDPLTQNKENKKLFVLEKKQEQKLAKLASRLFQVENNVEETQFKNKFYIEQIENLKKKYFLKLEELLNLPISNGNIYIVDNFNNTQKNDLNFTFFILPNGDIFASKLLLQQITDKQNNKIKEQFLINLMIFEYSHIYLRSNIASLPFSAISIFLKFKSKNYSEPYSQYPSDCIIKLREIFLRQYSDKQQKIAFECAQEIKQVIEQIQTSENQEKINPIQINNQIHMKQQYQQFYDFILKKNKQLQLSEIQKQQRGDIFRRHINFIELIYDKSE